MLLFKRYEYDPKSDLIGKGGFSRVYKAIDKKFNRSVALKIYKTNEVSEKYNLISEIQRVIGLDHPNISRYLDIEEIEKEDSFGQVEKIQVCVMELLESGNLATFYYVNKDLSIFQKLLIDVLHGLSYLHANGIIHRDIKPANILIKQTPGGPVAKITDFGISKRSDASDNSSSSGLIVSIPYMAPEQLNGQKYGIDEKIHFNIDLWSLGVTVYEILSGDVLFKNAELDSSEQIMSNIVVQELPEKIKNLPEPFKEFVARCLVKDAKKRVKSADELILLLKPELSKKTKTKEIHNDQSVYTQPEEVIEEKHENVILQGKTTDKETNISTSDDTALLPKSLLEKMVQDSVNDTPGNVDENETRLLKNNSITKPGSQELNPDDIKPVIEESSTQNTKQLIQQTYAEPEKSDGKITLFNRYTYYPLNDLIGKGGFSRVYKAMDQKLGRWVALKIYKTSEFSDRYSPIAEIKRVVNLDHSNICRYLDIEEIEKVNPFGEVEKIQVCVMELLDSGNFLEYFNNCGRNLDVLKKLLQDVLNGISYLHKNGIIHRDIKPANILIKKSIEGPVAKITDFGISKVSDSVNNHSSSSLIVSIPYMAPEQLNIKKYGINEKINYNLDLWSLGVTIYEVITGKVLFKNSEQDSSEQIMTNIMAPELPEKINELPQPFRNIVSHCIVKNANERAQKAEELMVLLNSPKIENSPEETVAPVVLKQEDIVINKAKPPVPVKTDPEKVVKIPDVINSSTEIKENPVQKNKFFISEPIQADDIKKTKKPAPPSPPKAKQPAIERKFSIAEPAPEIEKRAKKQISLLKILIAAATILLILASVFYFNISSNEKVSDNIIVNDSTYNKKSVSIKTPDTSIKDNNIFDSTKNTKEPEKNKIVPPIKPVTEKQEKKAEVIPEIKQTKEKIEKSVSKKDVTSENLYTLNISASTPCTITKNGSHAGSIVKGGQKLQLYLAPGKYKISAKKQDGISSEKLIEITEKQVNQKQTGKMVFD